MLAQLDSLKNKACKSQKIKDNKALKNKDNKSHKEIIKTLNNLALKIKFK